MYVNRKVVNEILASLSDTKRLFFLNMLEQQHHAVEYSAAAVAGRKYDLRCVREFAEDGYVALVNGGRDCDNSVWHNRVSLVPANMAAVDEWVKDFYEHAEGPQWHHIERPSVAKQLRSSSHDLALEAFEDGHPHVIYA